MRILLTSHTLRAIHNLQADGVDDHTIIRHIESKERVRKATIALAKVNESYKKLIVTTNLSDSSQINIHNIVG